MVKLIRNSFILGKARVRVTGLSLESLLNMAAENGIVLENVIRTEYACIEADVLRSDLKKLYRLIPEQSYKTAYRTQGCFFYGECKYSQNCTVLGNDSCFFGIDCSVTAHMGDSGNGKQPARADRANAAGVRFA